MEWVYNVEKYDGQKDKRNIQLFIQINKTRRDSFKFLFCAAFPTQIDIINGSNGRDLNARIRRFLWLF